MEQSNSYERYRSGEALSGNEPQLRGTMATKEGSGIVSSEASEIHDEPHVEGHRISVRHLHEQVEERNLPPQTVADRLELDVADVYRALAYYHDHPREMRDVKEERDDAIDDFRESIDRPAGVDPDAA